MHSIWDEKATDTTFRMSNVHANAQMLGVEFNVPGPYFFSYSRGLHGTLTVAANGNQVTIQTWMYQAIVAGTVDADALVRELRLRNPLTAVHLMRIVRHMHATGPLRAMAYELELNRVTHAREMEPVRARLRAQGKGPS